LRSGELIRRFDYLNESLGFLNESLGLIHLLVIGDDDFFNDGILFHHLDLGDWLDQITLEVFVDDRLNGLDTKDIAADLVAELNLASLQSEERGVAAFLNWSLELNGDLESGTSNNFLLERDDLGRHVIT